MARSFKHIDTITALFVTVLLVSNITSTKLTQLAGLTLDGGTILFPLSYIFGDVLTEVYGYQRSRKVIWLGFMCAALMSITFIGVGALPSAPGWQFQPAYEQILGFTPRLVIASLIAYVVGEFANSYVMATLKVRTQGKWLWMRTIASTLIGQLFDTGLFILIAFTGVVTVDVLMMLIGSNYVFKCGVEIVFTPITYWITGWLKYQEQEDYYDVTTNFNPFQFGPEKGQER